MNSSSVAPVSTVAPANVAGSDGSAATRTASSWKSSVPNAQKSESIPRMKPRSPTRLTMKAFLPASDADCFVNQKPMSRYEQRPTPSQPTNITGKLAPSTSTSMKEANRLRYEKYRAYSLSDSSCMYAVEYR